MITALWGSFSQNQWERSTEAAAPPPSESPRERQRGLRKAPPGVEQLPLSWQRGRAAAILICSDLEISGLLPLLCSGCRGSESSGADGATRAPPRDRSSSAQGPAPAGDGGDAGGLEPCWARAGQAGGGQQPPGASLYGWGDAGDLSEPSPFLGRSST